MKQIMLALGRRPSPRPNFKAFTSAICSFAILMMPFAQVAAATRGNQRSQLGYQRSKVKDGQFGNRSAKNANANDLFEPALIIGSPTMGATLTDNRPGTDPMVANPGDTIHYTATISNTGTADATGVQFNNDVDGNTTVVTGSVKMSPLAFPDSYNGVANTQLIVAAAQGVLANDFGLPAPTAMAISNGPTTQGGTVTLNSDGSFTYTPPANFAGGSDTFTYTATNGQSPNDTATVTIATPCQTINVTNPTNTAGTASAAFNETFTQAGSIGGATFTTASTLPAGLTLATNGVLSGAPTQTGSFPIVVTVTDGNGCTGTGSTYTLVIGCQTITVTNPSNSNGTAGSAFNKTFTETGSIGTPTFTTASTLPAGLSLATTGVLSGTPTQTGSFPIVVTVTDSNGCTGTSATYTLVIGCQTITVNNPANSNGTAGSAFSETFTQSGSIGTATFSTASTLPTGLSLATNGVLSGTPTQTGSFPIVVTVTDSNGCTGTSATYTLVIGCQTITVTNPANSNGTASSAFSETFTETASIGTATFTTASSLPTGLGLATNGVLSGTPTQTGSFPIVVTVTDSNGCTGTGPTYTLTIAPEPPLMFAEGGVLAALDSPSLLSNFMLPLTAPVFETERDGRGAANTSHSISRSLTETELNATVAVAIQRWSANGLTQKQIATVLRLKFEVADLSGRYLGEANSNRVLVSRDAQGKGWFIDSNTSSDSSFAHAVSSTRLYAEPWGAPAGHIDLLTAIEHEIGHKLGLNDTYAEEDRDNLMYGYLTVGERRLPGQNQARYARGYSQAGPHFLSLAANEKTEAGIQKSGAGKSNQARRLKLETRNAKPLTPGPIACTTTSTHVCVDVGTLRPGKSVTITFSVTVNTPYGGGTSVSNQGTVSGSNFSDVATDDPDTGAANDATVTPICGANLLVTNTNDSGNGSLRQTILNLCPGGIITFDPALTAGGPATITLLSELVIDKNMTINGPTNNGLTISGNNASRVFNINVGVSLSIASLTIANGLASQGGGILNAGTLTITGSTISTNKTTNGADASGAANGGNSGNGGGIYNTGTLTLINSTVGGNQTGRGGNNLSGTTGNGGNSGSGAGIYSTGTVKLTNTTITDNQTGEVGHVAPTDPAPPGVPGTVGTGGGVSNSGGTLTFNNTILANNHDGFDNEDDINGTVNSSSSFNFIGSSAGFTGISDGSNGNRIGAFDSPLSPLLGALADNGGPTRTYLPQGGSPVVDAGSNALAKDQSNNALTTDQRGAGFPRVLNGTVEIGAVETLEAPAGAGTDLTVSKSADVDQVVPDRDITYTITVRNIGGSPATSATMSDTLPQVTTSSSSIPSYSPMTFVSLSSPAGWACSTPSVGAGGTITCTRASVAGSSIHTFTLVGHVPPGAVPNSEFPFISNAVTVSATNDPNNENDSGSASTLLVSCVSNPVVTTSADSGAGSLRQAIADACSGSTITFDMTPGHVVSPITLTTAELLINKDLTITGPGANLLTVTRSTGPSFRIFNVASGAVKISGLTISNGNGGGGFGGGILYGASTLTVTNSTISGNSAAGGAGISNSSGGTLTVTNSTISGNTAGTLGGGGIFSGSGVLNITNSTITGNSSTDGGGGGINSGGTATVANSTISNNSTTGGADGGGIRNTGTVNSRNSIIAGNTASSGGPDFSGTLNSQDYNLIGNTSGATISGTTTHNITNQSANLAVLANNGGPTQTMLPLPGSPAINAGDPANLPPDSFDLDGDSNTTEPLPVDQRGFARVVGANFDIGAVETNYAITATAGTPQSTAVNTAFATALKVTVTESGTPKSGVSVTFTAPGSGASGAFPGPSATAVVTTDAGSVATAPTFTANASGGSYNVIASIGTGLPTATFALTNNKLSQTITFAQPADKTFGNPDFTVTATTTSGLVVSFAASGNCTVTTGTVHITGAGSCTITASQTGNATYNAAPDVPRTFNIAKAATSTAVTSSVNPSNSGQSVTFTATVTSTAGTPTGTVQFKDNGVNLGAPQALNGSGIAQLTTSSLTAGSHPITADYSGDGNFNASSGTLSGGQTVGAVLMFSSTTYNTTENSRAVTITVQRTGDSSQAVTVDYATPDDSSATPTILPCSTAGFVSPRCDFTTAAGTLKFAAGENSKTFEVLISQDNYVEGNESFSLTLSNPSNGSALGTPSTANVNIADDVTEPAANPIDDSTNFVRQHYHDFLNREPLPGDSAGLNFWVNQIEGCGSDQACRDLKRINVSGAFFLSIEFQQTGFYVYRTYKAGFGDINPPSVPVPLRFREFVADTQEVQRGVVVGQGAWQAQLDANKQAYALAFVTRTAFLTRYPGSTSATSFVDTLNANAGNVLNPTERAALISELTPNPADPALRGDVLMKVAENAVLKQQEMNRSFVLMQYFGYLRRNPDAAPEPGLNFAGYNFWLNKLNQFNGNFVNADMVKAFITSSEYRKRFGQ